MKYLVKNKHWEINKDYNIDKLLYLLVDKPTVNCGNENYFWYRNNSIGYDVGRDYDFPAYISPNSSYLEWCKNGKIYKKIPFSY